MGRHYQMTEEERAEARRAYRKAYYAKKREELLAAREIARGLGCPERKRGRPRLSDEERLERRRERQRAYQKKRAEQARRWRELKAQAVREGLALNETRTDLIYVP